MWPLLLSLSPESPGWELALNLGQRGPTPTRTPSLDRPLAALVAFLDALVKSRSESQVCMTDS